MRLALVTAAVLLAFAAPAGAQVPPPGADDFDCRLAAPPPPLHPTGAP